MIEPYFVKDDVQDPLEEKIQLEKRDARIIGVNGRPVFEQEGVEFPAGFSDTAVNVVASKYFKGKPGTPEREYWGTKDGYFANAEEGTIFQKELYYILAKQIASFNSPVWFNVGLKEYPSEGFRWDPDREEAVPIQPGEHYPQSSACFILDVEDSLRDILQWYVEEGMIFKYGSGAGINLSKLRSSKEFLSSGGHPSGPVSFMKAADISASTIKSGGKHRRAAKMVVLDVTHPDIVEFIESKVKEEEKARALIAAGYSPDFTDENGAYASVFYQNANHAVRVTDEFMRAVEDGRTFWTRGVDGSKVEELDARKVFDQIVQSAWKCADPGLQFADAINRKHTCAEAGPIMASNPCVTGDTLVATRNGLVRIDQIQEPVEVLGSDGKFYPVSNSFFTGIKPVFVLRTRSGYRLQLTADHRVSTRNRGDVPASELRAGDQIVLGPPVFGNRSLDKMKANLLGAIMGRGLFADFEVSEISGSELATYIEGDPDTNQVAFTSRVFELDRGSVARILRSLFTVSGSCLAVAGSSPGLDEPLILLSGQTRRLLEQVQLLLLGFGICSQIIEEPKLGLAISRRFAKWFEKAIGFLAGSVQQRELARLDLPDSLDDIELIDGFASLTPAGDQPVYDLTEPATHHFVANGIVVHNCSEFVFLNNSACNLASINLMAFYSKDHPGYFDLNAFRHTVRVLITAQEILVGHSGYPTPAIAEHSWKYRPLGLGYTNLGAFLMSCGQPYDSAIARSMAGGITAIMTGEAYKTSAALAARMGPFAEFPANRQDVLRVLKQHEKAVWKEYVQASNNRLEESIDFWGLAVKTWEEILPVVERDGVRNAQMTLLAPTGTISLMMDCDTTGIEPCLSLVNNKKLVGGGAIKRVASLPVRRALESLGYNEADSLAILDYLEQHGHLEGAPHLRPEHLTVFDTSFPSGPSRRSIHYLGHLKMMAAVQPFLSGAISKTINLPRDATVEDVEQCFRQAWKLGLKCVTVYRDGSKSSQPVSASKDKRSEGTGQAAGLEREKESSRPTVLAEDQQVIVPFSINHTRTRVRLPDTRKAITHKFSISGHEGYFTVGLYDDGSPGELFVKIAKEGSTISGMMDMVGLLVSMALQWGVPLKSIITKLKGMHFEPSGWTQNPNIHFAKSIADYLARWLEIQFVDEQQPLLFPGDGHEDRHEKAAPALSGKESGELPALDLSDSGPPCPDCGALMVPNGTCYQCLNCGVTSGCS